MSGLQNAAICAKILYCTVIYNLSSDHAQLLTNVLSSAGARSSRRQKTIENDGLIATGCSLCIVPQVLDSNVLTNKTHFTELNIDYITSLYTSTSKKYLTLYHYIHKKNTIRNTRRDIIFTSRKPWAAARARRIQSDSFLSVLLGECKWFALCYKLWRNVMRFSQTPVYE